MRKSYLNRLCNKTLNDVLLFLLVMMQINNALAGSNDLGSHIFTNGERRVIATELIREYKTAHDTWLTETKLSVANPIESKAQALRAFNGLQKKYAAKIPKDDRLNRKFGEVELIEGYFVQMKRKINLPVVILIAKQGDREVACFLRGP